MQKRTAFAALALTVFSLTGVAFAAGKFAYNPFTDMTDSHGHILKAAHHFSGEVKLYDRDSRYIGSFGTDGQENAPIAANIQVDGGTIAVKGAGRHVLRTPAGELIGYADLLPESSAQRARLRADHEKAMGHEEVLPVSSGCDDGWGTALGFFGSQQEGGLLTWRFTGAGEARFLHNGKVVRAGIASPVTPLEAEALRRTMTASEFQQKVRANPPNPPVFEWTAGGVTHRHTGYVSLPLTLPNGTALTVEFLPQKSK